MHIVSGTVRLSADLNFAIPKAEMSIAEVLLLRRIHRGDDVVVDIKYVRTEPRTLRAERERLLEAYNGQSNPDNAARIEALFANVAVQPIERLSDVAGLEMLDPDYSPQTTYVAQERPHVAQVIRPALDALGEPAAPVVAADEDEDILPPDGELPPEPVPAMALSMDDDDPMEDMSLEAMREAAMKERAAFEAEARGRALADAALAPRQPRRLAGK